MSILLTGEVVLDFGLYPRQTVNEVHVTDLAAGGPYGRFTAAPVA